VQIIAPNFDVVLEGLQNSYLAKNCMVTIKPWSCHCGDKKLAAIGILS
jgi:hypothetical protein